MVKQKSDNTSRQGVFVGPTCLQPSLFSFCFSLLLLLSYLSHLIRMHHVKDLEFRIKTRLILLITLYEVKNPLVDSQEHDLARMGSRVLPRAARCLGPPLITELRGPLRPPRWSKLYLPGDVRHT